MSDRYDAAVREFHTAFGLPVRDTLSVGTPEERVLRVRLMLEEVLEFARAAGVVVRASGQRVSAHDGLAAEAHYLPDTTAMAQELADVAYVTHGTAVQLGIPLLSVFAEVHAANMRKRGTDGTVTRIGGKVMKPPGWTPADIEAVLATYHAGSKP